MMLMNILNSGFGSVLTHIKDGILEVPDVTFSLSNKNNIENMISQICKFLLLERKQTKVSTSLMGSIALIKTDIIRCRVVRIVR